MSVAEGISSTESREDALARFKRVFGIARAAPSSTAIRPIKISLPSSISVNNAAAVILNIANEKYELVRSLQSGGFANVVEICHMATRKRYALKKTSLEYLDYAENEILTMTELRSASRVIQLHSHQNGPDVFYTVMELGGVDFFDLTNGRRLRDPLLRRDYFRQMCICTQQLHKLGKVHRDLKRENFISALQEPCLICNPRALTAPATTTPPPKCIHTPDTPQLKLTDFGCTVSLPSVAPARPPFVPKQVALRAPSLTPLAQRGHHMATVIGGVSSSAFESAVDELAYEEIYCTEEVGTDVYLPPEACTTDVNGCYRWSQRSDIWALGIMLFEMVWGRRPFTSRQTVETQPLLLPLPGAKDEDPTPTEIELDEQSRNHLYEVMRWCLEKDPRRRPSIEALMRHPYLAAVDLPPPPPPPPAPAPPAPLLPQPAGQNLSLAERFKMMAPFNIPPPPPIPSDIPPPPPQDAPGGPASISSAAQAFRARMAQSTAAVSAANIAPVPTTPATRLFRFNASSLLSASGSSVPPPPPPE